jgi:hypothetical protein
MHGPINVKSPNNTSKWQVGFNSAFKGLRIGTNGEVLFDRTKPTAGCSDNGRRRFYGWK